MALLELNSRPNPRQVRMFGAIGMPLSLTVGASLAWLRFDSEAVAVALLASAILIEATTWVAPSLVRVLMIAFNVVTYPLAWTMSHLAMAFLFFGVLTPLGWIVRTIHGDPLARGPDARLDSYWTPRPAPSLDRYFRQY